MSNTTLERLQSIIDAHQHSNYTDMRDMAHELLSGDPENADVCYLYGVALCCLNEFAQGTAALQKAVSLCPESNTGLLANAQSQLGTVLRKTGKAREAEQLYRKLIRKFPDQLATYGNLSFLLNDEKRYSETLRLLRPTMKKAHLDQGILINLGNAHRGLGNLKEAHGAYMRALRMEGKWKNGALANLAMLDFLEGHLEEAKRRLLQLHTNSACPQEGYLNLALIETALGNHADALHWLSFVDGSELSSTSALVSYVTNKCALNAPMDAIARIHDWISDHDADLAILCAWYGAGIKYCLFEELRKVQPLLLQQLADADAVTVDESHLFNFMACHGVSASHLLQAAKKSARNLGRSCTPFSHRPRKHARLRIGYLSPDFRDHPVAHLMIGIFAAHDKTLFETYGYNIGKNDESVYRYRCIGYLDTFRECRKMSGEELAKNIYDDEIDVLVDLCGYTEFCKPVTLCYKPAPVIISYLGFVGTMGLPEIDYIIADEVVMPRKLMAAFTEKPIYLPRCYQVTDGTLEVQTVTRTEMRIPENAFVFVSFNNVYKLNPHYVSLWSKILHLCPDAVLWLYAKGLVRENLVIEFHRLGISPERLFFFERQSKERFLGALALADLFLDSSPYNAGTTASDALYAGCPVLTQPGETYSSRMCASILTHAGLPEMVTESDEQYTVLACRMYSDAAFCAAIRQKARQARYSRLYDTEDATRCLERAYQAAYVRFASGKKAAPISVADPGWTGRQEKGKPFAGKRISRNEVEQIAAKLKQAAGTTAVTSLWSALTPHMPQTTREDSMKKTLLHVGCGPQRILGAYGFAPDTWQECRLDIDPDVNPDVVGTMTDMAAVADASVSAVFSSHNIEHLHPHEVPVALREFCRVLSDDGLLVLTCPDLQSVCALVAQGKLLEPAYHTAEGLSIAPIDILYGWRIPMANGNLYMAHKCGFTDKVLSNVILQNGFSKVACIASPERFSLFAVASKTTRTDEEMRALFTTHNVR